MRMFVLINREYIQLYRESMDRGEYTVEDDTGEEDTENIGDR